ncbi:MAG: sugar ABC transporter permease [Bacillota bacterium]
MLRNLAGTSPPRRRWRLVGRDPLLFAVPALVLIAGLIVLPSLETLWLALVKPDGTFAGLSNFADVLADRETLNLARFPGQAPPWGSLIHNALWIAVHLPVTTGLGLLLALALQRVRGAGLLRGFIFLGMVMPMIVGGVLIRFLFDENAGIVNALLRSVGLEAWGRSWTAYPDTALLALILGSVWLWAGFTMVLYSAGLATIPRDFYEAAAVDGAGALQQFRYITLPALRPVTAVVVAMTVLWELKIFDIVYTATQGGPGGSSMVLALQMYFYAFRALDPHHSAAVATMLTLFTLVVGVWFVRTTGREE